jgi:predicted  nucleic acid-binding Zn-ribbon protein
MGRRRRSVSALALGSATGEASAAVSDLRELETRIDRLHHLLRAVDDEAARRELERLLAEARRDLEKVRRTTR